MQSRDNHRSVIAVYWIALGLLLGYTFVRLLEEPIQPTIIIYKQAEQICQVEIQRSRAKNLSLHRENNPTINQVGKIMSQGIRL